jgi:hypothetical protein
VAQPMRAAASAASVPAWPPPTTMTSNDLGNCTLDPAWTWDFELQGDGRRRANSR